MGLEIGCKRPKLDGTAHVPHLFFEEPDRLSQPSDEGPRNVVYRAVDEVDELLEA